MSINPQVFFVIACQLECENGEITDERWKCLDLETPVFGPSEEQLKAARGRDLSDDEQFRYSCYIGAGVIFSGMLKDNPKLKVCDLLVFDDEYGAQGWVGMQLAKLPYNNDTLWALATIHQEYHSITAFHELPLLPPEDNIGEHACWWKMAQNGYEVKYPRMVESYQRLLDDGHNYRTFQLYIDSYVDRGLWLFNEILDFGLERKDLRLGVFWIWS